MLVIGGNLTLWGLAYQSSYRSVHRGAGVVQWSSQNRGGGHGDGAPSWLRASRRSVETTTYITAGEARGDDVGVGQEE